MTSRTAKANWFSEHLPEEHRVRLAIAIYVLIVIVAIVVSGWLLLGAITVAALSGALYARYIDNPGSDEYVIDDGWRRQFYPVAGAFFVLACFALGRWPLVVVVGLIALATVGFRSRNRGSRHATGTRGWRGRSQEDRPRDDSAIGERPVSGLLDEIESARDEALAAIEERAMARERSLTARKMASDGADLARLESAEGRLLECEQQIRLFGRRLEEVEGSVDETATIRNLLDEMGEKGASDLGEGRSPIRLVEPDEQRSQEAFSMRADAAATLDKRQPEGEVARLASIADLERSLDERDSDLTEREAEIKAMGNELEERTEQRETQIELRLRELEAREAQLSEKEQELERYVAQAQNAIRRQEAELRHEA